LNNNAPSRLFFSDSLTGISITSYGSWVVKTINGGKSWKKTEVQSYGSVSSFVDGRQGWVVGGGRISSTKDSGNTWVSKFDSTGLTFSSIYFSDSLHGCAGGKGPEGNVVLTTSDGGKNWRVKATPVNGTLNAVHFSDPATIIAVGNYPKDPWPGMIIRSSDSGNTWQEITKGPRNDLFAVSPIDSQTCFAAGRDGIILKTTDGGKNWKQRRGQTDSAITGMYFLNRDTGWAVGWHGYIIRTVDGGTSWQQQNSNTLTPLYRVFFVNSMVGSIALT
jgi:photosystem II stability/assembly factor-like uncharacterized protein